MNEDPREELLRVKARESRYKKEAEEKIAHLEDALRKALETGANIGVHEDNLRAARDEIDSLRQKLAEALSREEHLNEQVRESMERAEREKDALSAEIDGLKRQLKTACDTSGEMDRKLAEALAQASAGADAKCASLERELELARQNGDKLKLDLAACHDKLAAIKDFAAENRDVKTAIKHALSSQADVMTAYLSELSGICATRRDILKKAQEEISSESLLRKLFNFSMDDPPFPKENLVALLKDLEIRSATQKARIAALLEKYRSFAIVANFHSDPETGAESGDLFADLESLNEKSVLVCVLEEELRKSIQDERSEKLAAALKEKLLDAFERIIARNNELFNFIRTSGWGCRLLLAIREYDLRKEGD